MLNEGVYRSMCLFTWSLFLRCLMPGSLEVPEKERINKKTVARKFYRVSKGDPHRD